MQIIELGLPEELKVKYSFLWTIVVIIGTGITTYEVYAYDIRKKIKSNPFSHSIVC
ncbi:MAG: hypothetical protein IJC02_13815 [Lachnospiraceae bacterium]|nr:hypothetical protein [Lachnospiraceae bacterium]